MPICMYFPDILNPYIFEEDNTILEKPLDIRLSKRLYTLLDNSTNLHDIEIFDIINSNFPHRLMMPYF